MNDNVCDGLTESWQKLLPSIAPDESLPYFPQILSRTAAQFRPQTIDEFTARRQAIAEAQTDESRRTNTQPGS